MAAPTGIEPVTKRLTAACSTAELHFRNRNSLAETVAGTWFASPSCTVYIHPPLCLIFFISDGVYNQQLTHLIQRH